jgi:hypothetical protein
MRIGFYVRQQFHNTILRPVYDICRARHECIISSSFNETIAFRPHVVVQSEGPLQISRLRGALPTAAIIHTRHGLALKNASHAAVQQSDYTCVTSDWMRAEYVAAGVQPRRALMDRAQHALAAPFARQKIEGDLCQLFFLHHLGWRNENFQRIKPRLRYQTSQNLRREKLRAVDL